jgi:hypothetical protein
MKKIIYFSILFLILTFAISCSDDDDKKIITISGTVFLKDTTTAVDNIMVKLYKDSKLLTHFITKTDGKFSFKVEESNYALGVNDNRVPPEYGGSEKNFILQKYSNLIIYIVKDIDTDATLTTSDISAVIKK